MGSGIGWISCFRDDNFGYQNDQYIEIIVILKRKPFAFRCTGFAQIPNNIKEKDTANSTQYHRQQQEASAVRPDFFFAERSQTDKQATKEINMIRRLNPAEAKRKKDEDNALLANIREPQEFANSCIEGARLAPLSVLPFLAPDPDGERSAIFYSSERKG